MQDIKFWLDRQTGAIDPTLFSIRAEELAKLLAGECERSRKRENKRTQIRKFYDEVVRLNMDAKKLDDKTWARTLPLVHMLVAKAAYAKGRKLVSANFVAFIRFSITQIKEPKDLAVFANFFEAFMGFYRLHCPAN